VAPKQMKVGAPAKRREKNFCRVLHFLALKAPIVVFLTVVSTVLASFLFAVLLLTVPSVPSHL